MTSTLDLVVLLASLVVCLMLLAITALVIAETRRPKPKPDSIDEILREISVRRGRVDRLLTPRSDRGPR